MSQASSLGCRLVPLQALSYRGVQWEPVQGLFRSEYCVTAGEVSMLLLHSLLMSLGISPPRDTARDGEPLLTPLMNCGVKANQP